LVASLATGFLASLGLLASSFMQGAGGLPRLEMAVSLFQFSATGAALAIVAFYSSKSIGTLQLLAHTSVFLTDEMPRAFKASLLASSLNEADWSISRQIDDIATAFVKIDHVRGTPSATYALEALGSRIQLRVTLNAFRFVVLYYIPRTGDVSQESVSTAIELVRVGAESAGYTCKVATNPASDRQTLFVEVYFYRTAEQDLLLDTSARLFWSQDIAVMTKSMMLQLQRHGIALE
jgi:hypothetical protein